MKIIIQIIFLFVTNIFKESNEKEICIENIQKEFYNLLFTPDNSKYYKKLILQFLMFNNIKNIYKYGIYFLKLKIYSKNIKKILLIN